MSALAAPTADAQRLIAGVRAVASKAETRIAYIAEYTAKLRDQHRANQKEFDQAIALYLRALESYQLTSGSQVELLCALTTLGVLLDVQLTSSQLSQCNSSIRVCLLSSSDFSTIVAVAKLLGKSAAISGPNDFARKAIDDAMVWIGLTESRSEARRVGGLAVISEVVERVPVLFLKHLPEFFERVWTPLADPIPEVREAAVQAFSKGMRLVSSRDRQTRMGLFATVFNKLRSAMQSKNVDQNIGGLLVFECVIVTSMESHDAPKYEEVLAILQPLLLVASSTSLPQGVRQHLFKVFSVLCRFNPAAFVQYNLKNAVNFGLEYCRRDAERPFAFRMLGEIIELVKPEGFEPFLDQTIVVIKQVFLQQKKQGKQPLWEALECLAVICKVSPSVSVEAHVSSCIEHVFGYGLSSQLIECMRDIVSSSSPSARTKLEENMLDLISLTICGLPFRQNRGGSETKQTDFTLIPQQDSTEEQIAIALDALLKFGFSNSEQLGDFLRDSVLPFLGSDKSVIRSAAIRTLTALLIPPSTSSGRELTLSRRICLDQVVTRLLLLGESDNDPSLRRLVFSSFSPAFYPFLCEAQFLGHVCNALGDEAPLCRVAVVELICGLLPYNPSQVLPVMRKEITRLLQTIATTDHSSLLVQSMEVLSAIAKRGPLFVRAFHRNILDVITPIFLKVHPRAPHLESLLTCIQCVCQASMLSSYRCQTTSRTTVQIVEKSLDLLHVLPADRVNEPIRLQCVAALASLLRPAYGDRSPYQMFPTLYKVVSSIVRNKEETLEIRLEALRVLGRIGAMDPHQFSALDISDGSAVNTSETIIAFGKLNQKRCARAVLQSMSVVLDPRNARVAAGSESLLRSAVKTVLLICERSCVSHEEVRVVFPSLCSLLLTLTDCRLFYTVLFEMANLIVISGPKSYEHLGCFEELVVSLWKMEKSRFLLVRMCSALTAQEQKDSSSQAMGEFLARILPMMLDSFTVSTDEYFRRSVLELVVTHAAHLQPFIYRLCGSFLEILDSRATSQEHCAQVLVVLAQTARTHPLQEMISPLVRSLLALIAHSMTTIIPVPTESHPLIARILSLLRVLVAQQGVAFAPFAADVLRCLKLHRLANQELTFMCTQAYRGSEGKVLLSTKSVQEADAHMQELQQVLVASCAKGLAELGEIWGSSTQVKVDADDCQPDVVLPINERTLMEKCKITASSARGEWHRWFEELCKAIIQEAPYPIFRCVSTSPGVNSPSLIDRSSAFVDEILNLAFRCVYHYANNNLRCTLLDTLAKALANPAVPDDVASSILSIAEYMDMIGYAFPIPAIQFAETARAKGMLAKALYWQEASYKINRVECEQDLISIYSSLEHKDSAVGLLRATASGDIPVAQQQANLIKLGKFAEALDLIAQAASTSPMTLSIVDADSILKTSLVTSPSARPAIRHPRQRSLSTLSDTDNSFTVAEGEVAKKLDVDVRQIMCLSEVGDMHSVLAQWRITFAKLKSQRQDEDEFNSLLNYVAPFAADAAVRLRSWEDLSDALTWIPRDTIPFGAAQAALHISNKNYDAAEASVRGARKLLLDDIAGLMHESYARSYDGIVVAQQLVELEETIATLRIASVDDAAYRAQVGEVARLWSERLSRVAQSVSTWKRILACHGLLIPPTEDVSTRILFVKLCREYGGSTRLERFTLEQMLGCRSPTYDQLIDPASNPRVVFEYVTHLSACRELGRYSAYGDEHKIISKLIDVHGGKPENTVLEARMHARRGYGASVSEAIECYATATKCDPNWFRGWRFWAEANTKFLEQNRGTIENGDVHVTHAIHGFVKAIELAPTTSNALQDVLKLLSLWGRYADNPAGLGELERRVFSVSLTVWQLVIPQLIARLDLGSDSSCALVAEVIAAVALEHPQSLIYPLNVCTTSAVERREKWANVILERMEKKFPRLVAQGKVVSTELIRISGLIYEQWYETLEDAAAAFFGRRSPLEMLEVVLPAHEKLKKAPETIVEVEFHAKHLRLLEEARNWIKSYTLTGKIVDLHCAWNVYHGIYKQIDEQLKKSNVLAMQYCSPRLWEARNLELTIPEARPLEGRGTVKIASFDDKLTVIASKQRPKRIAMLGTDGKTHKFLLKGHEDLRLDERVMQLFRLVNTLLLANPHTNKIAGYQIQRYSVTPLWDKVGLIGWVDECDTIVQLVHAYREERGILPELELRMMQNIITVDHGKAFDYLPVMSKVEVLEFLWDHTSGNDIRKAMWSSSLSCETWLERRKTFTTSLATMSVVGYILGLGDRHPNNIMIQRSTGKVVHIDFGDCFEVAMTRDRFPEKVPFRLTRMLQNAMEVCGVDGIFRCSAETVMTALRDNKDSLLAMLGAFVQDPLISWRLVKRSDDDPATSPVKKLDEMNMNEQMPEVFKDDEDVPSPLMAMVPYSDSDTGALDMTRARVELDEKAPNEEELAHQGVAILNRLASKLRGQDFATRDGSSSARNRRGEYRHSQDPKVQVSRLIKEATSITNIAQSWSGWYPFW